MTSNEKIKLLTKDEIEKFLDMEVKFKLDEVEHKGIYIWPIVRYSVYIALLGNIGFYLTERKRPLLNKNRRKQYSRLILKFFSALLNFYRLFGKTDIILLANPKLHNIEEHKEISRLVWAFRKSLMGSKRITVIDFYSREAKGNKNILDISFIASLGRYFAKRLNLVPFRIIKSEIGHAVNNTFGQSIRFDDVNISFVDAYIKGLIIKLIIKLKNPKFMIYEDDSTFSYAISVANRAGVTTIDCQHAMQSGQNILYRHNQSHINDNYRDYLSSNVMTYGDYWNKYFTQSYSVISVGNPYFEIMRDKVHNVTKSLNTILFISDAANTREKFEDLIRHIAKEIPSISIYIKLRNEEYENWREFYSQDIQCLKNVFFIDDNKKDLYYYLKKANYVIGTNSTVLVEALAFSNVIVIKHGWYIEMLDWIENGNMLLAEDKDHLTSIFKNKIEPNNPVDIEKIFKSNAIENYSHEINLLY